MSKWYEVGGEEVVAFILMLLLVVFVGASLMRLGYKAGREVMQDEAVEHGAAEYDSVTGEWKWKN